MELSLKEVFLGSEKEVNYKRIDKCSKCFGYKSAPGHRPSNCFNCEGLGEVTSITFIVKVLVRFTRKMCSQCNGQGYVIKNPCQYNVCNNTESAVL